MDLDNYDLSIENTIQKRKRNSEYDSGNDRMIKIYDKKRDNDISI